MNILGSASREAVSQRRRSANSVSTFTLSATLLAGLSAMALLSGAGSATAKPMTSCQIKHSFCSERCLMNNADGGMCIRRTCDVQHRGCGNDGSSKIDPPVRGKGGKARLVQQNTSPAASTTMPIRQATSVNTGPTIRNHRRK